MSKISEDWDKDTFTIDKDVQYVVIGPIESALQACKEEATPACWQNAPSSHCGGTVLVNDVSMRVPVLTGEWSSGKLFNFTNDMCGGMVWHTSVGSEADAARLLYEMENAGAPPTANVENEAIVSMGIRFIGRYSWKEPQSMPNDPLAAELYDNAWVHFRGPQCVFAPTNTFQSCILPDVLSRLRDMQERLQKLIEQRLAAGEEEPYRNYFKEMAMRDNAFIDIAYPPVSVFDMSGVLYTFRLHEYMFGRLWFTPDMKCRAFCCFTYAAPAYFGQMRLGDTRVCAKLPVLSPDRSLWENYFEQLTTALLELPDDKFAESLTDLTSCMREDLFYSCRYTGPALFKRLFSLNLLSVTAKFFRMMVSKAFVSGTAHSDVALEILANTTDDVLQEVIASDVQIYHTVNNGLADGSYDPANPTAEMLSHRRSSIFGDFIKEPHVLKALLQRGFPPDFMLATTRFEWFRNVLCDAAAEGLIETVKLLLDAGADVNRVVSGDHWNTFVYAANSGCEELVTLLCERYPEHEIWTRDDIPLEPKVLPRQQAKSLHFAWKSPSDDEAVEAPLAKYGKLETILNNSKQRKVAAMAPPPPPGGGFTFTSFSFPAK